MSEGRSKKSKQIFTPQKIVEDKEKKKRNEDKETIEKERRKKDTLIIQEKLGSLSQKSDEKRTLWTNSRRKNQFIGICSPTTKPKEELDKEKISWRGLSRTETGICPKKRVSLERKSYTADLQYDSPGKRKFDAMDSKIKSNKVQELIGNFEVGNRTKRLRTEMDSS